ncbi:MAG: dihydroorotate dehydrogenase electron transfer subunit [Clostridia bacterium]|nr:dihydroorotate dehydrogenase electron transfer subunit [Clostridia bacterium]
MKQTYFTITSNVALTSDVYQMTLVGDTQGIKCGQFVNIKVDGFYLRRPISVCDVVGDELTLIYKVVGGGTEAMSKMPVGHRLDLLTQLGNGYDVDATQSHAVLLGGGVGVPPLYKLAKDLVALGKQVTVILGFNTQSEIFYEQQFASLGAKVLVTTVDGSYGIKGFVTDALKLVEGYDYFYTCGPEPMLKAVYNATTTSGQFSFEERMGCGFGACMGCSCETKYKTLRICKEGPVLTKEVIVW